MTVCPPGSSISPAWTYVCRIAASPLLATGARHLTRQRSRGAESQDDETGGRRGGLRPHGRRRAQRLRVQRPDERTDLVYQPRWRRLRPHQGRPGADSPPSAPTAAGGEYSIKIQQLPNSASDQRQQVLRRLAASDAGMDIMRLDPVFVAEFAEPGLAGRRGARRTSRRRSPQDAVKPIIDVGDVEGQARRGAHVGEHPAALVPQVGRQQAAGLDMTKRRHLGPADRSGADDRRRRSACSPGCTRATWSGSTRSSRGRAGIIAKSGADNANTMELGLDTAAGRTGRRGHQKVASTGVGGPAMGSHDETTSVDLFRPRTTSGFMVNWPYVWNAVTAAEHGDRSATSAFARYPQTVAGQPSKPPLGGIETRREQREHRSRTQAWKAVECITNAGAPDAVHGQDGKPGRAQGRVRRPQVTKAFPNGLAAMIRDVARRGRAPAADAVLRRRVHRAAEDVQPARAR